MGLYFFPPAFMFCQGVKTLPGPQPPTQNESSVRTCTHCATCFCMFGADLYAQSVLVNKISASELTRKFIKSALLVGFVCE